MTRTLVVLAAGMGSRYGGLKQLDRVGPSGETIIDYSVFDAVKAGFSRVVFIIRRDLEDDFRRQLGNRYERFIEVIYAFQELSSLPEGYSVPSGRIKPWGTGHALLSARELLDEPFMVINADDFYGRESYIMAFNHLGTFNSEELAAALVGFLLKNTMSEHGSVSRGICQSRNGGFLSGVEEVHGIHSGTIGIHSDSSLRLMGGELVSMNMWLFSPGVLEPMTRYFRDFLESRSGELKSEFYIPLAVNRMIEESILKVRILETSDQWFGVTYREDKTLVKSRMETLVSRDVYPVNLWEG